MVIEPCPCCGDKGSLEQVACYDLKGTSYLRIRCRRCGAQSPKSGWNDSTADAWNRGPIEIKAEVA